MGAVGGMGAVGCEPHGQGWEGLGGGVGELGKERVVEFGGGGIGWLGELIY